MKAGAGLALVASLAIGAAPAAWATPQEAQQPKQTYTRQEYDAYNTAANEKDLQQRLRLLDGFVNNYPNSTLMPYVFQAYFDTYNQLRNYPKVIEYADKLRALGEQIEIKSRLQTLVLRSQAFELSFNARDPNARDHLSRAREADLQGLKLVDQLPKPQDKTDDQFTEEKKPATAFFNNAAGFVSLQLKDYAAAVNHYKAALAANPKDAVSFYRMGIAYLQMAPPNSMDAFWSLARAIALKLPNEAQVRNYLRNQMLRYQVPQPSCEKLLDAEMNELLTLAAGSPDRPANYKIYSSAELDAARQGMTVLSVINDLKAGGDRAKLIWLAACGLEFPDVPGKILEVTPTADSVTLKLFLGATDEEIQAATTPNMEVKVVGQPEAARLQKDEGARFTGTLASYDPEPFMLHWDKARVNPEDIPQAKVQPSKQPAKKAPTKRPPVKKPGR